MIKLVYSVGLCIVLVLSSTLASAASGFGVGVGTNRGRGDNAPMDFYRVSYQWDWQKNWFEQGNWYLTARNELSIIRLITDVEVKRKFAKSSLTAVAITPIFRFRRKAFENGFAPFAEAGIGIAYFNETEIQTQPQWFRDFGSNFQFEDRISVGLLYQERYRLSVDFTHYSNADFNNANEGIDLISASLAFNF